MTILEMRERLAEVDELERLRAENKRLKRELCEAERDRDVARYYMDMMGRLNAQRADALGGMPSWYVPQSIAQAHAQGTAMMNRRQLGAFGLAPESASLARALFG